MAKNWVVSIRPVSPYQRPSPQSSGSGLNAPGGCLSKPTTRARSADPARSMGFYAFIALVILAASIFAKFVACWAAALAVGQGNARALGLGALMNARGLTELIIINIGLQAGIIGPTLFSMLVLMAIVTTLMASPLFELVYGRAARARGEIR